MKLETFRCLWDANINKWLHSTIVAANGETTEISMLCKVSDKIEGKNTVDYVHSVYEKLKSNVKKYYFNSYNDDADTHLSRYKRAAVITYAVILSNPLCKLDGKPFEFDDDFLKQRLAFFLALATILQDFDAQKIKDCAKPLFYFSELDKQSTGAGDDNFCLSLYKDLFFSEIYENYNVLTMANVYGLLTERCSRLPECRPSKPTVNS